MKSLKSLFSKFLHGDKNESPAAGIDFKVKQLVRSQPDRITVAAVSPGADWNDEKIHPVVDGKKRAASKLDQFNSYLSGFDQVELVMNYFDGFNLMLAGKTNLNQEIAFALCFSEVGKATLTKTIRLKKGSQSVCIDGHRDELMIIKLMDENNQAHLIACDTFDYEIIKGNTRRFFLEPHLKYLEDKVEKVNHYFTHQNINGFRVRFYNGHTLRLVAGFDIGYCHDIELLFFGIKKMDVDFYSGSGFLDEDQPFLSYKETEDGFFEFAFPSDDRIRSSLICEDFDCRIERVKYYDRKGRLKKDIRY